MLTLAIIVVGCGGGAVEQTGQAAVQSAEADPPSLVITSPQDDASFTLGDEVTLEARALAGDGSPASGTGVTWFTADGWQAVGSPIQVTDLPGGTYTLVASTSIGGIMADDIVEITVAGPIRYDGAFSTSGVLDNDVFGVVTNLCVSEYLALELNGADFFGSGACTLDVGFQAQRFDFFLTGVVSSASVTGTMTSPQLGGKPLPFAGSHDLGTGKFDASFDATFGVPGGSIRLFGSFDAEPTGFSPFHLTGDANDGAAVFADTCALCHGADGSGISGPPINDVVAGLSDRYVTYVMRSGINSMPPQALDDQQTVDVLAYIRATFP